MPSGYSSPVCFFTQSWKSKSQVVGKKKKREIQIDKNNRGAQ
jgi:hypothetical protein